MAIVVSSHPGPIDQMGRQYLFTLSSSSLGDAIFQLHFAAQYAAFNFLANENGWQRWFLAGLALLVSGFIIVWLTQLKVTHRWLASALALVLGGAIGNVIDRLLYGYVIDFLDVYYQEWHWPAFNIADSAISIGAIMLLIDALRGGHRYE